MPQPETAPDAQPIRRFPRLSAEDAAAVERTEDRIAALDKQIFKSIADRRKASIEAGRAFNELRRILGHGKWLPHFNEVFAPTGLKLRSAQRWMKRARKAESDSRNVTVAHSESATDTSARAIKDAAERDEADVSAVSDLKKPRKGSRPYSLSLHLTDEEQEAMDALQKLAGWPQAEKRSSICCVMFASSTELSKTLRGTHEDKVVET